MVIPTRFAMCCHGSSEVAEELVNHAVVAGRHHQVESALLPVEVPPSIVHAVTDGVHVDGDGSELEQRQVRV
jgi:hypothetical protein